MNTNKTPQWEIRFEDFYFNEEYDGSADEIKAFIKSTLEEVIEDIKPNDRDSYTNHVLQDLINKLKDRWL